MVERQINLIIKKDSDSPAVKKLRVFGPIVAVILLALFVIAFFVALVYTNSNINQYNALKRETDAVEQKISSNKNTEGIYTLTNTLLTTINQILATKKNFNPLLDQVLELKIGGTNITSAKADQKGNVDLTLIASSSAALVNFVENIMSVEEKKLLTGIKASGITRNKNGQYLLNITFLADKQLLQ